MLQKKTDTIDVVFVVHSSSKISLRSPKHPISNRHVWILFRYQCLLRHGKTSDVTKTFRGKDGRKRELTRDHVTISRLRRVILFLLVPSFQV